MTNIKDSAMQLLALLEKEKKYLKAKKKNSNTKVPDLTLKEKQLKSKLKKQVLLYFLE